MLTYKSFARQQILFPAIDTRVSALVLQGLPRRKRFARSSPHYMCKYRKSQLLHTLFTHKVVELDTLSPDWTRGIITFSKPIGKHLPQVRCKWFLSQVGVLLSKGRRNSPLNRFEGSGGAGENIEEGGRVPACTQKIVVAGRNPRIVGSPCTSCLLG
jgi:hypothetical protein